MTDQCPIRLGMELILWAQKQRQPITARRIQERFDVHRSTALRHLTRLAETLGVSVLKVRSSDGRSWASALHLTGEKKCD